ncbi:hypothetical protein HS7_16660 [Sulfolobales archaeon HS-7]|nr:hypothetical protein HS7_16660 [Sulfolobales archaeon HS-7]
MTSNENNSLNFEEMRNVTPLKRGEAVGQDESEEGFYIKLDEERTYEVAPVAFYVWNMCDGKRTVSDIANEIVSEVKAESVGEQIDEDKVINSIMVILGELLKASLIALNA